MFLMCPAIDLNDNLNPHQPLVHTQDDPDPYQPLVLDPTRTGQLLARLNRDLDP